MLLEMLRRFIGLNGWTVVMVMIICNSICEDALLKIKMAVKRMMAWVLHRWCWIGWRFCPFCSLIEKNALRGDHECWIVSLYTAPHRVPLRLFFFAEGFVCLLLFISLIRNNALSHFLVFHKSSKEILFQIPRSATSSFGCFFLWRGHPIWIHILSCSHMGRLG